MANERDDTLFYDLMDEITEPADKDTTKIVVNDGEPTVMPFAEHYEFLLKIPYDRIASTDTDVRKVIAELTELITISLDACYCVTDFSDVVFTTNLESLSQNIPEVMYDQKFMFVGQFGGHKDNLVANVAINIDKRNVKQVFLMFYRLYNVLHLHTDDTYPMIVGVCPKKENTWSDIRQQNMFYLDSSFPKFVKSGGKESNTTYRAALTCTYGLIYNLIETFYPEKETKLQARDKLLSCFPNFDLTEVNYIVCNIAVQTSSLEEIYIPAEITHDIMNMNVLMNTRDREDSEFYYTTELLIQPIYRKGNFLLNGGYTMIPWIEGRQMPGNREISKMKDEMMWYEHEGHELSIRQFSMKWRVVGAKLWLYVFFCPETVVTDEGHMVDCCVCVKMDVHERAPRSTDFFIEWFINAINEDIFQGQLPEEKLIDLLVEDRLNRFNV